MKIEKKYFLKFCFLHLATKNNPLFMSLLSTLTNNNNTQNNRPSQSPSPKLNLKSPGTPKTLNRPHPYKTYSDEDRVKVGGVARKLGASIAARYFGIPESTVRHFRDKFDKYAARHDNATNILNGLSGMEGITAHISNLANGSQSNGSNASNSNGNDSSSPKGQNSNGDDDKDSKSLAKSLDILTSLANNGDLSALPSLLGSDSGIKRDSDAANNDKVKDFFGEVFGLKKKISKKKFFLRKKKYFLLMRKY